MKKNVVIMLALCSIIGTTGCGINSNEGTVNTSSESTLFEPISEGVASGEASTGNEQTEAASNGSSENEASSEDSYDAYQKYLDYISPKDKATVKLDPESEKLYQAFIDGTEPAQYDIDVDIAEYICLSEVLENGKSYTLNEIKEKLSSEGQYGEGWLYEIQSEGYIDLGLDESYELCMDIGASEFNLTLVVKNIDGKLKICFAGDSWSRNMTVVKYSGYVESYGSGGANYHGGQTGYIDANGKYHFWYRSTEEGILPDDDGKLTHNDQLIGENIGMYLDSFSFDRSYEGKEYQYVYIVDSEGREDVDVDLSQPGNAYEMAQKAIESSGNTYVSDTEAKALMDEQRKTIGLSDEIYKYGDELYPY
ncbi:hypothetical protein [Butyrivibrio sp. INlla14]|uniref:hypothetical protein n=1 Tax=Butyrivibrio sp. INlla14 TaxID=1520808 RepID=UPI000876A0CE|nr:hypothetical protein [Butyrivibrio sp. INlla14]SCX95177.1 hypothetical protein SAMN02910371_00496 [Butyrivibrio sp. INlla14]